MKLIVRLFFLLMPVFANCQTNDNTIQSQTDTSSFIMPSLSREWDVPEFVEVFKFIIAKQNDSAGIITFNNNGPLLAKVTDIKNYFFLRVKIIRLMNVSLSAFRFRVL